MANLIGRKEEQQLLDEAFLSNKSEFIALYGRRRVGKTHLVRTTFADKEDSVFFYVTGIKDGLLSEQLKTFADSIGTAFIMPGAQLIVPQNWRDALKLLTNYIAASPKKKIVLFFDEFPWMATPNSRLLQMLEHYWNHYWSQDARIKLIVCGSSSGWILRKIVNNRGGLYNRITETIHLQPFNLSQTKQYLLSENIDLSNVMIMHLYMVLGGIPHYLSKIKSGQSALQVIERLAFNKNSFLLQEFNNLYATLFDASEGHIEIARIIAQHHYGIGQEELTRAAKDISSGGGLVRKLRDLEEAGFIQRFKPFLSKKKGIYYKMVDEYSLFYFQWIEPAKDAILTEGVKGYWLKMQQSPRWHAWAGYSFESLCYKHIPQISAALNLPPISLAYSWRHVSPKGSSEQGAQIDLLFDREDKIVTVCEIKYTEEPFDIQKQYADELLRKIAVFKKETKTKKHIFLSVVSASGLKKNTYSELLVRGVVSGDDLFKNANS